MATRAPASGERGGATPRASRPLLLRQRAASPAAAARGWPRAATPSRPKSKRRTGMAALDADIGRVRRRSRGLPCRSSGCGAAACRPRTRIGARTASARPARRPSSASRPRPSAIARCRRPRRGGAVGRAPEAREAAEARRWRIAVEAASGRSSAPKRRRSRSLERRASIGEARRRRSAVGAATAGGRCASARPRDAAADGGAGGPADEEARAA